MATKTNTEINGQNYFRITRTVGHKIVDGKTRPVKKQFYGSSKGDAEKRYNEYLKQQAQAKYESEQIMDTATLNYRANEFISNAFMVSEKYADNTKKKYENCYRNHIENTWLDKMAVKDIKAVDIQQFYNEADVSKAVLDTMQKFMRIMYKWMVRNGYAYDVLSAVEKPKKKDNKRKDEIVVWTDEELDCIKTGIIGRRDEFLFLTFIFILA